MKHVVFDFDGTLISSMDYVYKALGKVLSEHFQRELEKSEVVELFHHDPAILFERIKVADKATQMAMIERYQRYANTVDKQYNLFDGVDNLLEQLSDQHYKRYIWTARDRTSTLEILAQLGLSDYFEDIRSASDCAIKPNPAGLTEMVGHLGREEVIVIGDSYVDIAGANNFGCSSIGVYWCGDSTEAPLVEVGATYTTDCPENCLKLIKTHFNA